MISIYALDEYDMFRKELSRISKTLDCRFLENMHLGSFFKSNNALHERKYSPLVLNKENVWLIVSTVYSSSILSKIPRCCEIILQKYKHRQLTFFYNERSSHQNMQFTTYQILSSNAKGKNASHA